MPHLVVVVAAAASRRGGSLDMAMVAVARDGMLRASEIPRVLWRDVGYRPDGSAVHKAAGREDPTDNEGVRRVMQGIPRTHDRAQRQAKPLTAEGPGRCQGHRKEPALPGHRRTSLFSA